MKNKDYPVRMILDCTLRDGGYVNNWEFDRDTVFRIMDGLYESGVRFIELGIMAGKGGELGRSTKFSNFSQVEPLLSHRQQDCVYALMLNQADVEQYEIPPRNEKTVDLLRLAFFKKEKDEAMAKAEELKSKGYKVFLQAMATFMYSADELSELLTMVNQVGPAGFYIVDSFSTMYRQDVQKMAGFVLGRLSEDIQFGFHAHNNIQMAYANIISFWELAPERPLIADGSIYGMGRGAGNVPTELLMEYLNKTGNGQYNIGKVLEVFQQCIEPIFQRYYWGFSHPYYLTASKNMNSVYGWYLMNHGINDIGDLGAIMDRIPENIKYTLSRDAVDIAARRYYEERKDD